MNCIKITYYKLEGGGQKKVTLPSIYLPDSIEVESGDTLNPDVIMETLLAIAKDSSHPAYVPVQQMLNDNIVSSSIKQVIDDEAIQEGNSKIQAEPALKSPKEVLLDKISNVYRDSVNFTNSKDIKKQHFKQQSLNKGESDNLLSVLLQGTDIEIVFNSNEFDSNGLPLESGSTEYTQGLYYPSEGVIMIHTPDIDAPFREETVKDALIHELTHYHTVSNFTKNDLDAAEQIVKILKSHIKLDLVSSDSLAIAKHVVGLEPVTAAKEIAAYYVSNGTFASDVDTIYPTYRDEILAKLYVLGGTDNINTLLNVLSRRVNATPVIQPDTTGVSSTTESEESLDVSNVNYNDLSDGNDLIDQDSEKEDDDVDSGPSTKPLEMNVNFGNLFTQVLPIKISNKADVTKAAPIIRNTFNSAVESKTKSSKYTRNYDRAVNLSKYNRASAHSLVQNDIILIPVNEKVDGNWVKSDVKSTYAPIISSFVHTESKKLVFQVATRSGKSKLVDADDVLGYRKFLGNLNAKNVVTPKSELAKIWANYGALAFGEYDFSYGDDIVKVQEKGRLYSKMTFNENEFETKVYDNEVSTYVSLNIDHNSNKKLNEQEGINKVYTGRDDNYDVKNFENLKQGDVVKIVSKDKDGKKITYYAPIVKVFGDKVEIVKSPGKTKDLSNLTTHFVDKHKISGVYMLHENHIDRLNKLEETLGAITEDGFYNTQGLMKNSFINVNRDGRPSDKANWNDLDAIIGNADKKAFFESYSNWRKGLTDTEYKALREKDLDATIITYLRYSRAIDRRMAITDKLGVGGYVQLETVPWKKNADTDKWEKDTSKPFRPVFGTVLAKNGKWLTVRTANVKFNDAGQKIPGEYDYKTIKVNVLDTHPSMEEKGAKYAIRATYYDNTQHMPVIDLFNNLKQNTKGNWKDFNSLIDYHQGNKNINAEDYDFSKFGIKNIGESYRKSKDNLTDGYIPTNATKLADYYSLRFFDENSSTDEKLKAMSRLKKGSVVLVEVDEDAKTTAKYSTSIVLGFDERSGLPLVGYSYASKNNNEIDIDFNNVKSNYVVSSMHPSKIVGVGYSKATHKDADGNVIVEIDDYIKRDGIKRAEIYIDSRKLNVYDNAADAEQKQKNLSKYNTSILELYESKSTGRRVTDIDKVEGDYTTKYAVVFNNENKTTGKAYQTDVNSSYRDVYSKSFENQNTKYILDEVLKPGDVLVEKYTPSDSTKDRYNDLVIDDIVGDMVYATAYYPKKGTSGRELEDLSNYEAYPRVLLMKNDKGVGLPNISRIKLNYYRNAETSKIRKSKLEENQPDYKRTQNGSSPLKAKPSIDPAVTNGDVSRQVGKPAKPIVQPKSTAADVDVNPFLSKASDFKYSGDVNLNTLKALGARLSALYNVPVNYMSSDELFEMFDSGGSYDVSRHRAFVKEGVIYINTDYATLAEPIHEMGHLVLQGLRTTDSTYYGALMSKMRTHPFYSKVAAFYPELSDQDLDEEVFVTVLGEHYNGSKNNVKTENWEKTNAGFFTDLFARIKNFFARLFGIDEHDFFKINDYDLMNSSFDDIMDNFNNKLLNGRYKSEVENATAKFEHLNNNTYLKNSAGRKSSFYLAMVDAGFDDKFASDSWINSKSSTFALWHKGELFTNPDGEPKIMYATSNPYILTETDEDGVGNVVLLRGNHQVNEDGSILLSNVNDTKSIYGLQIEEVSEMRPRTIEEFSSHENLPMLGNLGVVRSTIRRLEKQFSNYIFEPQTLIDNVYYVKHYSKPNEFVLNLKNELFSKNLIQAVC